MNDLISKIEDKYMKKEIPQIEPGDTVRVHLQVTEGDGEDQQTRRYAFEGTVIACSGAGINRSITVRRVSFGIGVERTFPLHSPTVEDVEIVRRADVRRAKLYYLRNRHERAARLKERKDAPQAASEDEVAEVEDKEVEPEAQQSVDDAESQAATLPEETSTEQPVAESSGAEAETDEEQS